MQTKSSNVLQLLFFMLPVLYACNSNIAASKQDGLPYYCSAEFTPQWLDSRTADTAYRIPAFSFTDQEGKTITRTQLDGKITVVNFFFTACPGICKKLTTNMAVVQTAFSKDEQVVLLSHSVTPEHDSVPVLQQYAASHGVVAGKWHLLTGPQTVIYKMARSGYFADEDLGMQQDSTSFLHTEHILLIDKQHHIRGIYKGTIPAEIGNLVADIRKLETEK